MQNKGDAMPLELAPDQLPLRQDLVMQPVIGALRISQAGDRRHQFALS